MLDKKSSIYSDRLTLTMVGKIAGWDRTTGLLPYDKLLREHRRLISQLIGTRSSVTAFRHHLEAETSRFLLCLLQQPEHLTKHIRKTAGAIILKLSHGYQVQEGEDPLINFVDTVIDELST
ncbi:hypothetical protein AcW1_001799 [Taiwanofungus camphoratus]|nr:hypothetical protein AcW1_001799 [Antrodia cinnamomea]